jgi:hypothetical protein
LKAIPAENSGIYEYSHGKATLDSSITDTPVRSILNKSRSLTLVFRRHGFKRALERQCQALGIKYHAIPLDIPVRWSSTGVIIDSFLTLKEPIEAVYATQQLDASIKVFSLTEDDWALLQEVRDFLKIFERCTKEMQADDYPTLHRVIPHYFRMMEKLSVIKTEGTNQAIKSAASAAYSTLSDYYGKTKDIAAPYVATICDPRYKMKAFEWLWRDEGNASAAVRRARGHFKITYDKYKKRADDLRAIEIQKAIDNPTIPDSQGEDEDEEDVFFGYGGI